MGNYFSDEYESFNDVLRELDKDLENVTNPDVFNKADLTAYDIISVICNLEYSHRNVYKSKDTGQSFTRTKYGFQPSTLLNRSIENSRLKNELEF